MSGRVLVCGETLIDLIPRPDGAWQPRAGGSPANVATGLGRLDVPVSLLARLADDTFGRLLRGHLAESQVDLRHVVPAAQPTTLALLDVDGHGDAAYSFYVEGCTDGHWSFADLPERLPPDVAALAMSGSLALAVPGMGNTFDRLLVREHGSRTIVFDPNVRTPLIRDERAFRHRLAHWLQLATIVKVSEQDLARLHPGEDPRQVAARWLASGPALVVLTRGARGAYAVGVAGEVTVPAEPLGAPFVDTVGAGDAFTAGLVAALDEMDRLTLGRVSALTAEELAAALTAAGQVAAATCAQAGAVPPWRRTLPAGWPRVPVAH